MLQASDLVVLGDTRVTAGDCVNHSSSHAEAADLVPELARYGLATAWYGASIGRRSDDCALPVTPAAEAFSIWGVINAQLLPLPVVLTRDAERRDAAEALDASTDYFEAFVDDADNVAALDALTRADCALARLQNSVCAREPGGVQCCARTQHRTWTRLARALSEVILAARGRDCRDAGVNDTVARTRFAALVGAIVDDAPGVGAAEGPHARRAFEATVGWFYRWACDGDECPALAASDPSLAWVDALRRRPLATLTQDLVCLPEGLADP